MSTRAASLFRGEDWYARDLGEERYVDGELGRCTFFGATLDGCKLARLDPAGAVAWTRCQGARADGF